MDNLNVKNKNRFWFWIFIFDKNWGYNYSYCTPSSSGLGISQTRSQELNKTQNAMKSSNYFIQCLQNSWKSWGVLSNIRSFEEKEFTINSATIWGFIYTCSSCIPSSALPGISHIRSQVLSTRSQKMKTQ